VIYKALYAKSASVVIVPQEELEQFRATWRYHHKLETSQLPYAGQTARVKSVGFYHGGDVLYELNEIPGIWHECCLRPSP
jgi:hypothetical protein